MFLPGESQGRGTREGTRASRRVEEGLSRSLSGGGGKPSCPSPSAGDLRELPRVPLRGARCSCPLPNKFSLEYPEGFLQTHSLTMPLFCSPFPLFSDCVFAPASPSPQPKTPTQLPAHLHSSAPFRRHYNRLGGIAIFVSLGLFNQLFGLFKGDGRASQVAWW